SCCPPEPPSTTCQSRKFRICSTRSSGRPKPRQKVAPSPARKLPIPTARPDRPTPFRRSIVMPEPDPLDPAQLNPAPPRAASGHVLMCSMRDEGPFALEFVAHHRAIGFDRIFIASNDCRDGTDLLL